MLKMAQWRQQQCCCNHKCSTFSVKLINILWLLCYAHTFWKTVNKVYILSYISDDCPESCHLQNATAAGLILINAASHKACRVTSLMKLYNWDILPHPPYFPDTSPACFDLFPKLKEQLRREGFEHLDDLDVRRI